MAPPLDIQKQKSFHFRGTLSPDPRPGTLPLDQAGDLPQTPERAPSSKFATTPLVRTVLLHEISTAVCLYLGRGDVTFTMDDDNWLRLMTGQLSPQQVMYSLLTVCPLFDRFSLSFILPVY